MAVERILNDRRIDYLELEMESVVAVDGGKRGKTWARLTREVKRFKGARTYREKDGYFDRSDGKRRGGKVANAVFVAPGKKVRVRLDGGWERLPGIGKNTMGGWDDLKNCAGRSERGKQAVATVLTQQPNNLSKRD